MQECEAPVLTTETRGPTPIYIDRHRQLLIGYHNSKDALTLVTGFNGGFRIPYEGLLRGHYRENLKSVKEHKAVARKKVEKELKLGRIAGPYSAPPLEHFVVSPLGLVPKKKACNFRLIPHLSPTGGLSVNNGIHQEQCSLLSVV